MEKKVLSTKEAPAAIGPYSQGIAVGDFVYTSGQLPINPSTGELIVDDIKKATMQCLENIKAILITAGSDIDYIVKTTVFLKDLNDFAKVNEVYSEYFTEKMPARSAVKVARLPKDAPIEVEAIAVVK